MTRPPVFDPPYDSPLEEEFAWTFHKLLDQRCHFRKQYEVNTARGVFRIDFLVVSPRGLRLGIEVDGKGFHTHGKDLWRDAMILGERHVDVMLRFAARDVFYRLFDVIGVVRYLYPEVFNRDRVLAVDRLVSPSVESQVLDYPEYVQVQYEDEELTNGVLVEMSVSHEGHTDSASRSWCKEYELARDNPSLSISELHKGRFGYPL